MLTTKCDFKVGDRVVVVDESLEHFRERVGDTGIVTRVDLYGDSESVTILFDKGNGDNGWDYQPCRYDDAVAISMGILSLGVLYPNRGKHLPAKILRLQKQEIKWID